MASSKTGGGTGEFMGSPRARRVFWTAARYVQLAVVSSLLAGFALVAPAAATVQFEEAFGPAGNESFNNPSATATDSSGNVYVADSENDRIMKFDSSGNFLLAIGSSGSGNGQFSNPEGVAVIPGAPFADHILVVDSFNNRIQLLTPS